MFLFGIVLALLGTLFGLPGMRARLRVNLGQEGDLFLILYFGVFVSSLVVGPLIDRMGNKLVLVVSALLVTAGLGGFAPAHSFGAAAACVALLGVGGGGLNTAANVLVSDLYGADRGPMLNALGMFYAIGALLIPLLAASLSTVLPIRGLLLCSAALAAFAAAAYSVLRFPPARESKGFAARELLQVARYPGVALLAVLLFFEAGNESSIGGWVSSFAGSLGVDATTATWVLVGFWAAMTAGRLLATWLLQYIGKAQLVLASGAGSLAGCALVFAARSGVSLAAGAALAGLSFAAVFPTTLGIAGDRYPQFSGTVFGLLFSVGLLGGMCFPWAIGHLGNCFGMRQGLLLPLAGATLICALAALIRSRDPRS